MWKGLWWLPQALQRTSTTFRSNSQEWRSAAILGLGSNDQALTETVWKNKALISRIGKDVRADGTCNVMSGTSCTSFLKVHVCDLSLSIFGNSLIFNSTASELLPKPSVAYRT